jgi:hypothetical protein
MEVNANRPETMSHLMPMAPSAPSMDPTGTAGFNDVFSPNDITVQMMESYDFDPLGVIDFSNFAAGNLDSSLMYEL